MLAYTDYDDFENMQKVKTFDPANKLLPAIILIISVLLFRCRFNGEQSQDVVANEKVIVAHLGIFITFVLTYAASIILSSYYFSSTQGSLEKCRYYVAENYFYCFYITVNMLTLILFIFMSVKFSRPLNGYWNEFLLSYRKKTLSQAILARMPPTEQERARRYHEAAVRDSNR